MDAQPETDSLSQLSRRLVEVTARLAPALIPLRAGRWRTTGFRYGDAGLLLAAAHALEGVEEASAEVDGTAAHGKRSTGERPGLVAKVMGRDESLDLAVLELPGAAAAPPWKDLPLLAGQLLIGVNRPQGEVRSRLGQVSSVGAGSTTPLGGKLSATVEVSWLGRNPLTTLLSDVEGSAVGLAVGGRRGWVLTAAMLEAAVERIRRLGRVRRGYLGVVAQPVRLPASRAPQRVGLLVTAVEEQSPAGSAGLLLGDVLVGVAGERIDSLEDLWMALGPETVGQRVDLELLRAGVSQRVQVEVGGRP